MKKLEEMHCATSPARLSNPSIPFPGGNVFSREQPSFVNDNDIRYIAVALGRLERRVLFKERS